MSNTAKDVIVPLPNVFRIVFLYVGQGECTLLVVPDGESHKYVLVDSHQDSSAGGLDLIKLFKDLFENENSGIDVYVNTHPHCDHLGKIKELYNEDGIGISQVWHSGHKPGKKYKDAYDDLEYVIKKVGDQNVFVLRGANEENKLRKSNKEDEVAVVLGDVTYNVLAPAEYVADDIDDEDQDARYNRIHEQCGVIQFRYGKKEKKIMITGDADLDAWKKHITKYHKDKLPSTVLSAAHHGSNTFFWESSKAEGDAYEDHLNEIDPTYIIVSAPKRKESQHDHPADEAMKKYEDRVGKDNVKHLGHKRECIIVDISVDGEMDLYPDESLVESYGVETNENAKSVGAPSIVVTKVDTKPMGV